MSGVDIKVSSLLAQLSHGHTVELTLLQAADTCLGGTEAIASDCSKQCTQVDFPCLSQGGTEQSQLFPE